jgi:hypothetical protein
MDVLLDSTEAGILTAIPSLKLGQTLTTGTKILMKTMTATLFLLCQLLIKQMLLENISVLNKRA